MPAVQRRIFSDPVHGFITVEGDLLLALIQTPELQRLRRIRQLGVGYLVFPGAEHSRFGHALGAMALMDDALGSLAQQGVSISREEHEAARAAALLHDIGHGPFSHTLEDDLIEDFRHEDMSRTLLAAINSRFGGALDLTMQIFDNDYAHGLFHQLVSSQLDMDRLDYLRRDSYYTGVMEGVIGVSRIIKMMRPDGSPGGTLAFDQKSTYTIENFLQARRFMYWQVYLHRSVIAGDHLLKAILRRARHLASTRELPPASPALMYFMTSRISGSSLSSEEVWTTYCSLDDSDILYSIKLWQNAPDRILADLCRRFITRHLPKVRFVTDVPSTYRMDELRQKTESFLLSSGLVGSRSEAGENVDYYFRTGDVTHKAYDDRSGTINLIDAAGNLRELSEMDNSLTVSALTTTETRSYIVLPEEVYSEVT